MTPETRIDFYLADITDDPDAGAIPEPVTRIDNYLAHLCGETVTLQEPVTRIDHYLAYLCGMDVQIEEPVTRIDHYLAKLCGMDVEVPEPVTRIDYYLYQWASEPQGFLHTLTGSILHITDGLARPAESLTVSFGPIQTGSGDPSPDNVRPISGRTGLDVFVSNDNLLDPSGFVDGIYSSANFDVTASNTYISTKIYLKAGDYTLSASEAGATIDRRILNGSMSSANRSLPMNFTLNEDGWFGFSTSGKTLGFQINLGSTALPYEEYSGETKTVTFPSTVYGGTAEVVGGNGSKTWEAVDMGDIEWSVVDGAYPNLKRFRTVAFSTTAVAGDVVPSNVLCECFATHKWNDISSGAPDGVYVSTAGFVNIRAVDYSTAQEFQTAMKGKKLCYLLTETEPFSTTPTQIDILEGENNLWSTGDTMTLEYWGSEPDDPQILSNLNVLLGGRYYNNHTENEPTDAEALNILLGGNR